MHTLGRKPRSTRAGMTLIDLAIASSLLAVILTAVGTASLRVQQASAALERQADLSRRTVRALQRIADELHDVGIHTLDPDPTTQFGADSIEYQQPLGITTLGTVVWDAPARLAFVLDPAETENDLDDDADGLVDEGRVEMTRDVGTADEVTVVLCRNVAGLFAGEIADNALDDDGNTIVDEPGFAVRRVGDLIKIVLTLEARGSSDETLRWTASTSVVLHNE